MPAEGSTVELVTGLINLAVRGDQVRPGIQRELNQVEKDAEGTGKKAGSKLGSGMSAGVKTALSGLAGMAGGLAVGNFFKDSIDGARESQKVSRLTEQVIKTTGGAAKITATQVGDLASAISKKTGADDEMIQSGSNVLLTFSGIRNEVGKGNDVFNRATGLALDMSNAMGKDVTSSAKTLGRALNDPVKGMSLLERSGVKLTDAQKEQVKALTASGDKLGAQKILLDEVGKKYGGAAESTATFSDKAKVAFGNLQEDLGAKLLPKLESASKWFLEDGIPAIEGFFGAIGKGAGWLREHEGLVKAVGIAAGILAGAYAIGTAAIWAQNTAMAAQAAGGFARWLMQITKLTQMQTAAQWLLNTAMSANPLGIIIGLLVALGAGLVVAYKKSETFRSIVDGAFKAVSESGKWMWNKVLLPVFRSIVDGFFWVADKILAGAEKAFGWVPGIGDKLKGARKKFAEFKDSVNNSLHEIKDREVNVGISFKPGTKIYYAAKHMGIARGGHVKLADGGLMPGYTPGVDVHTFYSPTGGVLELSGGEPVLRPEAGRVLGRGWVDGINAAARTGGTAGVSRFLGGFASGGLIPRAWVPPHSTVDKGIGTESLRSIGSVVEKLKATGFAFGGPTIRGKIAGLVPEFLARLSAWNQAAGGEYWVNSGYRSIAHQWALWNASDKTGRMVAYPGKSRHNFGTAADLAPGTTAADRALARVFGLSFPMSYEPWHIQLLKSGGHIKPFVADSGVSLAPGINVVHNKLGKPEPLRRTDQPIELGPDTMGALIAVLYDALRIDGHRVRDVTAKYAARTVAI